MTQKEKAMSLGKEWGSEATVIPKQNIIVYQQFISEFF